MAIIKGGLFGNISGKIGGLVFATRNNQTEVKSLPKKYEGPVTEDALHTRAKFKLLMGFLRLFIFFINIGYPKPYKKRWSKFNVAFKENYDRVINGRYPNLEIDYSKVVFSKGYLAGLCGLEIDRVDRQLFKLKWVFNPTARGCDCIYCFLYNATDKYGFKVEVDAIRSDNYLLFSLPEKMIGKEIHLYVFLHSPTKKMASDTQHRYLDLREPSPNGKNSSFATSCGGDDEGVNVKKKSLSKVIKHQVIPKTVAPKKTLGKIGRSVREYTRNVLSERIGPRRKQIRQKRP